MSLTVETGAGIAGADSYASTATIDTYWSNRQHATLYTTWDGKTTAQKEGAAREATAYLDSVYGPYFRGYRKGDVQGLQWPRSEARNDLCFPLPALPPEIVNAVCELAARAVSSPLAADETLTGAIKRKREKVGPIEEETEFAGSAERFARYGAVTQMLEPVLNGAQPGGPAGWAFR